MKNVTEAAAPAPGGYKTLLTRYPDVLSFGLLHALTSSVGQTFFISLFAPAVCAAFVIDRTAFGSYYGAATILSGLSIPVVGAWIDKVSLRAYAAGCVLVLAGALAVLGQAPSLWLFLPALFFVRFLGQGVMTHINLTSTSRFFERSRGKALGITMLGHPLGEAVLPAVIVASIAAQGWRTTLLTAAAVVALVVVPLGQALLARRDPRPEAFFAPDDRRPDESTTSAAPGARSSSWTRGEVLRTPGFYLVVPFWIMPGLLLTGFFFHQLSLAAEMGWTDTWYTASFVAFAVCRALTSFLSGPLVDRVGARRLLLVSLVPLLLGVALLGAFRGAWVAPAYLALAGTMGLSATVKSTFLADLFGTAHIGAVRSLMVTAGVLGTAVCPPLFGLLLDGGWTFVDLAWASVGAGAAATALCALGLRRLERAAAARRAP